MIKAGIIGSTGYAGAMLTWLIYNHPMAEVEFLNAHSNAGSEYSDLYGNFQGFINEKTISMEQTEEKLKDIDVLFISMPHGKSFEIVPKALALGVKVIDLGADYRIKNANTYQQWYNVEHTQRQLLQRAVYGLPEINKAKIKEAELIANPGCYPTATILGLAPLVKNNLIDINSIIVDAKSGVSGAGRGTNVANLFCECNESVKAYGIGTHRHTPEIEQALGELSGKQVLINFTPHLIPMNRGILSTIYGSLFDKNINEQSLKDIYTEFYKDSPFVNLIDMPPETRNVKGTNNCRIYLKKDVRTGRIVVVSVIDNLVKGAAGQAIQNMNLMFSIDEKTGLKLIAQLP
ncbi:N-acetyl-gamma-glutamyl-phosphate reductase [Clostridium oryzae]|uniref:N-acetyl-gamma-glutamyl-phosphate reductase n=1 Tax=Clostridium oryzae TaxID=1450648 RepID=A0A1V4IPB9_9CLOT|nr:N-acetyl-gamma-glutamyl-phosphate reductase [Clostridium oryzae]OPJ61664.1 N-acetyl-gamma-glutamyl-phosphate reductase [Clostridium oryzae]